MNKQSEKVLEDNFIDTLGTLGYEKVNLTNEKDVLINLKQQLEKHNHEIYTNDEFTQILNHLKTGTVFQRSQKLRDRYTLKRQDGRDTYVEFLNQTKWCENQFQVAHQIPIDGAEKTRYDVTILINGLPLVQIELKRKGVNIKNAFTQIDRYKRESFYAGYGLWDYVQIFVISNGDETKYYANNHKSELNFKQTFHWTDRINRPIKKLNEFAITFLDRCHVSMMIARYIVLNKTDKKLMVLRPYQVYATEAIINRVNNTTEHGYIWHTTGSGKTLTSFKASQILVTLPKVYKVVFVVDRKDLDYQTINEFNAFDEGCVDPNTNTNDLTKKLNDDSKLVVTTIQKLNNVISKKRYEKKVKHLKNQRFIFIFDECHRNQFGKTRAAIEGYFEGTQMFGFTGTPIFDVNAVKIGKIEKTTDDLFKKCLHKYVINDAIADENVLGFRYEYYGAKLEKEEKETQKEFDDRVKVTYEDEKRKRNIVDFIINNHKKFTYNGDYNAMFAVNSVKTLIQYYEWLNEAKKRGEHEFRIATIFSCSSSQMLDVGDDSDETEGMTLTETKDYLEKFVNDYNEMYKCNHSVSDSQKFYSYYQNLARRVKSQEVDILLVVNMFLTGFDAKRLNTLYVDKNLKLQGLIQAFSRTNRILDLKKKRGLIISFRNLKENTDEAIELYSNKDNPIRVLDISYHDQKEKVKKAIRKLHDLAPNIASVDALEKEGKKAEYIKAVREVNRTLHEAKSFKDFDMKEIENEIAEIRLPEEKDVNTWLEEHTGKYVEITKPIVKPPEEGPGNDQPDFPEIDPEIELLERCDINVDYILSLLAKTKGQSDESKQKTIEDAMRVVMNDPNLAGSKELIEKFAYEILPGIEETDQIVVEYNNFKQREKSASFNKICQEYNADVMKLVALTENYMYNGKKPDMDSLAKVHIGAIGLLEREGYCERLFEAIKAHVELYDTEK